MSLLKQKLTGIFGKVRGWGKSIMSEEVKLIIRACHSYDVEALWEFTHGFLLLESRFGGKMSPHTLKAYKSGLKIFIQDMKEGNQSLLKLERTDAVL